jgi:hypothetical protein
MICSLTEDFTPDMLQGLTAIFLESGGIAKPLWRFVFG